MGKNRCGSTKQVRRKLKAKGSGGRGVTWIQLNYFFIVFGTGTPIYHLNLWVLFFHSLLFCFCALNKSKATESSLAQAANSSSAQAARHSSARAARPSSTKKAADDTDEEGYFSPADNRQKAVVSSTSVEAAKSSSAQAEKKKDSGGEGGKKPPLYKPGQAVLQWWASWFSSATTVEWLSENGNKKQARKKKPAWYRAEVTTAPVWRTAGAYYAGRTVEEAGWWYNAH